MGRINLNRRGDTIVEVLISIAVASLAIGISYATANRSLQQAITAKERNQALNLIENQITDLQYRKLKTDSATFDAYFTDQKNHFCLDNSASDPTNSTTWDPYFNDQSQNASADLAANMAYAAPPSPQQPYTSQCHHLIDNIDYYIDISTSQASGTGLKDSTVYQVFVRWARVGGGTNNQASIYYRF